MTAAVPPAVARFERIVVTKAYQCDVASAVREVALCRQNARYILRLALPGARTADARALRRDAAAVCLSIAGDARAYLAHKGPGWSLRSVRLEERMTEDAERLLSD
jgi:hypothetical protein